ncbi:cold-shock protein [Cellvibrio japonicus]|uniref:'Cold-shock' DNA-binding domain protein n=1 Tax=Cellvibrio japonicus (strain Ueda107) TaxID=498211 RepID=B3PIL3_CELJU|nr:cold shock domain-containing protein [Cellvibrio japonicus]ACE84768.1 'Cold-shock' DNA-binding domain protein [Cellvibrio japonicus Ueda107]QEI12607.1 cold shock domain-containing protein [Cellvibrio japonicus]QEI16181.1 cold shock domain-containing protein [Cellvibrio japonicus]QEI19759.1 cold shock domain-containing protein [Cellvibrio japonicus]
MKTTVKCWFADKGYGFLNNGGEFSKDIMVHVSELKNCEYLKPGRTVEFDCDFNQKGLIAKNVHLVYEEQSQPSHTRFDNKQPTSRFDNKQYFSQPSTWNSYRQMNR